MKKLVVGLAALLATALLVNPFSPGQVTLPTLAPSYGEVAVAAPLLLVFPELRP